MFPDRPVLGIGAGAYGTVLENSGNKSLPAHNLLLGILVEQGIVGAILFVGLLVACARNIVRMPPLDRKLWAVVMLSWTVGLMTLSIERWKVTWLLFGMLAAQSQTQAAASRGIRRRRTFPSGVRSSPHRQVVSASSRTVVPATKHFVLSDSRT